MKLLKNLLALVLVGAGIAMIGAPRPASAAEGCLKAEYVHNGQCQGTLKDMCSGPPECFGITVE
jgi:hypothetical protein